MKRFSDEAIQNTLRGMQVDPPESLVFDVMAKIRIMGKTPKLAPKGLVFGLGFGAIVVAVLAVVLTFSLPGQSPNEPLNMVAQKGETEMADDFARTSEFQPQTNEFPGGAATLSSDPSQIINNEGFYIVRTVTSNPDNYLKYLSRKLSSPTLAAQDGQPTVTVLVPSNQLNQVLDTITTPPDGNAQYQINKILQPPPNDGMVRLLIHVTK